MIDIENPIWITILTCFFLFVNAFFCLCWLKNPGYLQKSSKVSFLKLVEKFDPNMVKSHFINLTQIQLCPTCEVICSSDSRHCYVCNRCVERFDHHCQWINNCVGLRYINQFILILYRNHSFFYMFIASLAIYFIVIDIFAFASNWFSIIINNRYWPEFFWFICGK